MEMPPPLPRSAYTGMPASDSACTSRYTVRTETSSLSASSAAVNLSRSRSMYSISNIRLACIVIPPFAHSVPQRGVFCNLESGARSRYNR